MWQIIELSWNWIISISYNSFLLPTYKTQKKNFFGGVLRSIHSKLPIQIFLSSLPLRVFFPNNPDQFCTPTTLKHSKNIFIGDMEFKTSSILVKNGSWKALFFVYRESFTQIYIANQMTGFYTRVTLVWYEWTPYPANIYLFKINNKNTIKRCEICSKLTIIVIVNFEHIHTFF